MRRPPERVGRAGERGTDRPADPGRLPRLSPGKRHRPGHHDNTGAESNAAIRLARLGCDATWIGRVGDDDLGTAVVREIRAEGVTVLAGRDPDAPTGMMLKEMRGGRPRRVRYYRSTSAAARWCPEDLDPVVDVVAGARLIHVTGIAPALGSGPLAVVRRAIAISRDAGELLNAPYRDWSAAQIELLLRGIVAPRGDGLDRGGQGHLHQRVRRDGLRVSRATRPEHVRRPPRSARRAGGWPDRTPSSARRAVGPRGTGGAERDRRTSCHNLVVARLAVTNVDERGRGT
ncbi:hypothetical protein HX744_12925 [Pseudonocardia sp. ICBG1122]|nr:hypothetical protein [Pseudonocardia pini]